MDALTRRQFDRAMFAKERTLAIRVGEYASRDIKEASFEYGYIKGDTYKPGGTCAGSGKITFTSIITTFNKLDTLHPEIGLLVGDTYQWVKMGEYFINDIEIDRNRNTTTLELMDGMFKLNREYVTDLHFPAEVREVIQEICLKTGIELANDYFGISAMRYHIEQVPEGKKLSFRDMLSAMTQMIGMSCFFNREGKMEIRDLTESNITINADSYFLHGLTKSEIEYQIAGITCKTDKKSLTVGMKTGRSLELDNVFMTQSALNDLYYKLKNLTYYPYNLNYQGHLLLEVGQWVTIQTNKKETFKVPVLSQSFTFKGGLRGRISADSKAGNDTQYSYEGTITKQIKQQDGIEAKIQAQIEATDKDFDQKVDKIKKDFNDQVELAKARAEEVKRELSDTINQRFNSFDNGPLKETKSKAEEALRNAGASSSLAQEAKRIGLDSVARLEAFKSQTTSAQTALSGDLDALKRTIVNDIRPKQAQTETEIAKQAEALSRTKNELAGASSSLAQEAKRIGLDSVARLEAFKSQTTSAQTALSGDLDALKRTIVNDIRPKQAQTETEIAKQAEALSRTKNELAGASSSLAQEAKRIGLDSVARLEAFKSQTTSAQTALSGDLDVLKRTIANDIRPKQAQAEAEIAKQVEALSRTKNELAGVKSSQATYEETTTRRLSELTNLANGKASKSELTQTAEELASKIASVQVGGRNYIRGTKRMMLARGLWASGTFRPSGAGTAKTIDVSDSPATGFDKAIRLTSSNARDQIGIAQDGFYISQGTYTMSCWVKGRRGQKVKLQTYWQANDNSGISPIFTLKDETWTKLSFTSARNRAGVASIGYVYLVNAEVGEYLDVLAPQLEDGSLATSSKEALEDIEGQISTVESTFKQRANSLEAGVNRLTEGLRTKVDISALNVTAENIRQSVKSLETDTQNKLNQKLSQAEFEVRAGSIRQEILNATKDKASKSELTQTAEELASKIASVQVGGRNYIRNGQFKNGSKNWLEYQSVNFGLNFNYQHSQNPNNRNRPGLHFYHDSQDVANFFGIQQSFAFDGIRGEKVSVSLLVSKDGSDSYSGLKVALHYIKNKNIIGQEWQNIPSPQITSKYKRFTFTFTLSDDVENLNLMLFGEKGKTINLYVTDVQLERGSVATDYKEAPEDIEGQISTVESTFKQRANSLEAGVNRLTEGLRTKVDISALNVTAENIRQSVKSLETDTQNKLNQKLSQAEFEVRAGSIR
ncbi:peptidase S74, partial [Streptococcus pneumoniae]|nr:peptidase S74 [Streptococcus pneumoniae]